MTQQHHHQAHALGNVLTRSTSSTHKLCLIHSQAVWHTLTTSCLYYTNTKQSLCKLSERNHICRSPLDVNKSWLCVNLHAYILTCWMHRRMSAGKKWAWHPSQDMRERKEHRCVSRNEEKYGILMCFKKCGKQKSTHLSQDMRERKKDRPVSRQAGKRTQTHCKNQEKNRISTSI